MHRRTFIQQTALAGTGLFLAGQAGCTTAKPSAFGIQLYTLRDVLPGNAKNILKEVASFGYTQIESYEGPEGMWWGMGPKDFKQFTNDLGLDVVSSHCAWDKDLDIKAAEAAEVGLKYLICPYIGAQKSIDDYKRFAESFTEAGKVCQKHGLKFAYHNHDYSFTALDGQIPQDVLLAGTDPKLVDFEMDMYWVVTAGQDPIASMEKHPNRYRLCHIKDRGMGTGNDPKPESVTLGTGKIDYATILQKATKMGMEYLIVEQEAYTGTTPLKSTADNAAYLKKIKI
ncbi:MAG: sugar phosphate isomerase/epimerase [Bacteroidetes bacterium]|nr:MAG: sugar phosphate isomerase/epimerase [Bacteroidota bacterium]